MRIHHLNCCTMCPVGGKVFPSIFPPEIVCHCWLIDTGNGLVLVDTGISTHDVASPGRLGLTRGMLGMKYRKEDTALHQVLALGYKAEDVRWIIPTHLDLDHAGGIADFPNAEVHVWEDEYNMAHAQFHLMDRQRYRACQWKEHKHWKLYNEIAGERWFGFEAARQLPGLPPELLMVPLPGHSFGHWGIAVQSSGEDGWLFHVGDAYYDQRELKGSGPWGLGLFQRIANYDYKLAKKNQRRLAALKEDHPEITVVCAHDPHEYASCCSPA